MSKKDDVFNISLLQISDCPANFIPAGATITLGVDLAADGTEYTVKGFYEPKTGHYHIQEIIPAKTCTYPNCHCPFDHPGTPNSCFMGYADNPR
jgi:hypothetical protein